MIKNKNENLHLEKISSNSSNKQLEKVDNSPYNLYGIAVDLNKKLIYVTQTGRTGENGKLFYSGLNFEEWKILREGLKIPLGIDIEPDGSFLYLVENQYQGARWTISIQNKEGAGRLWRIDTLTGVKKPITRLNYISSIWVLLKGKNIEIEEFWQKMRGLLRWPTSVVVEKSKKLLLVTEAKRLSRVNLENGEITLALSIPLCFNLNAIALEEETILLLDAGVWGPSGYGRLYRGNLKNKSTEILKEEIPMATGLTLFTDKKVLITQGYSYPYGTVCEIDLNTRQQKKICEGLDEPRSIVLTPDHNYALITSRGGLYKLRLS